jgi:hypothetical protein
VNEMVALLQLHMPLLAQLIKNKRGKMPGQDNKDPWLQNFTKQTTKRLKEKQMIQETLDWMNSIIEAMNCSKAFPSAQIVLKWTKNQKEKCLETLARTESELNHLVEKYAPKEQRMREMIYDQWYNQMLEIPYPWHDYAYCSSD